MHKNYTHKQPLDDRRKMRGDVSNEKATDDDNITVADDPSMQCVDFMLQKMDCLENM